MKTINIIILIVIAVSIAIFVSVYNDSSMYVDFNTAKKNPGIEYHVVGTLNRDKPMVYNPEINPNHFEFFMKDSTETEVKVIYNEPKPADFDRSDKVVVIGKFKDPSGDFIAQKILLKCPSKYEAGENSK